jgi:replication initiation and membrane attachment protein DnaB
LSKIGQEKYEKLEYNFSEQVSSNGTDVSENIDYLFGSASSETISRTNLDNIIGELSKTYAKPVVVSDEVKGVIINYFNRNLMSLTKLITIVKNCVYEDKNDSNSLCVDINALTSLLEQSSETFLTVNSIK